MSKPVLILVVEDDPDRSLPKDTAAVGLGQARVPPPPIEWNHDGDDIATVSLGQAPGCPSTKPAVWRVRIDAGANAGASVSTNDAPLVIGTAEGVALRLRDPSVSRYHVELEASSRGLVIRDLGSTNGTWVASGGEPILLREGTVTGAVKLLLGRTRVELSPEAGPTAAEPSEADEGPPLPEALGRLQGASPAMRRVFSALLQAAPTSAPVLITGESGTGKELAARAVHDASPRAAKPFEVVDCGGLPPTLIESELFGHEKGAFTGATAAHEGAFERADGGTLFLDELGELPLELQPKLLRVLGEHEIKRVGGARSRRVDVRVVAATNRDLRLRVNSGHFRADLFYRLAVIQIRMPPLRDRLEDLHILVPSLLEAIARDRGIEIAVRVDSELLTQIAGHSWPGNLRELRNYLEQLAILRTAPALPVPDAGAPLPGAGDSPFRDLEELPLRVAKNELLERFERHYIQRALERTLGNVAEAARCAGVDRVTLFRAIRRHGLKD